MKILGILHTTRISTSLVISSIILLPALTHANITPQSLVLALNLLLTSMGGFALNDYYDWKKDTINKPHRPIASKKITRKEALIIAVVFLALSFVLAIYNSFNSYLGFMQIIFFASMIFYNYVTKFFALAKTIYTALISALVVFYPILINHFSYLYILLPIATFFFILGREIFMDILDLKGDKESGIFTLPLKLGVTGSVIIAFLSLFFGTVLVIPLFLPVVSTFNLVSVSIIISSVLLFSALWIYGSAKQRRLAILYLWLPMIMGLTTLL